MMFNITLDKIKGSRLLILLPVLLFIYIFISNAWVCDDALISFRVIDNFVHGLGLRWNISERVQAYTHPLWLLLNIPFYFFSREPFYTPIILSLILSFFILFIILKLSADNLRFALYILILCLSKAFVDFSSSGLENPLTNLLIVLFFLFFINYKAEGNRQFVLMGLIASLILLTRLDAALLIAPVLIYMISNKWSAQNLGRVILGLLPLLIWHIFSLIYYGFLFPNTAYAKLNTNIPSLDLMAQGFAYLGNSLRNDPITLIIVFLGIVLSFKAYNSNRKAFYLGLGNLLYILYIIKIGGDFMSGRFFATPFLLSLLLILILMADYTKRIVLLSALFIIIIGLIPKYSPAKSTINFPGKPEYLIDKNSEKPWAILPFTDINGITDERAFYYIERGLLPVLFRGHGRPLSPMYSLAVGSRYCEDIRVFVHGFTGLYGYYCGPEVYIIDFNALSDAFLARLPVRDSVWRIGHFSRKLPAGYYETVQSGKNLIQDYNLFEYYSKLQIIISAPVFSAGRLAEIINFNFGNYNRLLLTNYTPTKELYPSAGDYHSLAEWKNNQGYKLFLEKKYLGAIGRNLEALRFENQYLQPVIDIIDFSIELNDMDALKSNVLSMSETGVNKDVIINACIDRSLLISKKDITRAVKFLNSIGETNLADSKLWTNIGILYARDKNGIEAEKAWIKAITADQSYLPAYENLLRYYSVFMRDRQKAMRIADKIKSLGSTPNPEFMQLLN